jgi:hypothetical protein
MPTIHFPPDKRPLSRVKIMLIMLWQCESPEVPPTERGNPHGCTLHDIRESCGFPENGSFEEWYEWVKTISEQDAEFYYKQHEECRMCPTRLNHIKT